MLGVLKIYVLAWSAYNFGPSDSRNGCGIARSIGYNPGSMEKTRAKASYEGFPVFVGPETVVLFKSD